MCVSSAKQLWDELNERFGQVSGPLIFQLQRELNNIAQDNTLVSVYFSKLKRIWDEFHSLQGTPTCNCGALKACKCDLVKKIEANQSRNQLIQFLMGLNSGFEVVRNPILSMDPLPNVNKAYYIVQQVEKQKQISDLMNTNVESGAYAVQKQPLKGNNVTGGRKDYKKSKQDKFCDHCKMKGHTMDQCFKIHGYPEWYKGDRSKFGGSKFAAHIGSELQTFENPLKTEDNYGTSNIDANLMNTICQEVAKALQGKQFGAKPATAFTSTSEPSHFAGPYY